LLNGLRVARAGHARLFQFALLLALEGFFEVVHGSRNLARRTAVATAAPCDKRRRR
jgi:hypothetical protein